MDGAVAEQVEEIAGAMRAMIKWQRKTGITNIRERFLRQVWKLMKMIDLFTLESIAKGLKTRYGIDKVDKDKACPGDNCYYKVLLVLQVQSSNLTTGEETYSDYHWYRQDTDKSGKPTGTWSHKPGDSSVRGGVTDPERDAKRGDGRWFRYERICGYFCFPSCGVDAD